MAIWQFSMHLVARERLLTVSPDLRTSFRDHVEGDDEHDPLTWTTRQPVADLANRLSTLVPEEEKAWDSMTRIWGSSDQTTVRVSFDGDRVTEIFARLDLREETAGVIELLASLAGDSDAWWVGVDAHGRVPIGQTPQEIHQAIAGSDAARFVIDPSGFIADVSASVNSQS